MPAPYGPTIRPRRTLLRTLPLRLVEALRERASRASSSCLWAAACLATLLAAGRAGAQAPSPDQWITNGSVLTHVLIDSTLYVGGSFTAVGGVTGAGVPVDSVTALPTAGFPVVNGSVFAAIPDGSGGWFLGGQFTSVGGVARTNLARVLANGALSSWGPIADAPVRALALSGNTLYVGGDFLTLGGVARNRVGAVDITTGVTSAWNPNANASVRALAVGTAAVYVGGQFTTIGGAAIARLAQVNTTTGAVNTGWLPNPNNSVFALALNEAAGVLYAGGQFTILDGVTRNRIAQLESATGLATLWNAGSNNTVLSIALSPSAVYIGGLFTQIGTSLRNRLAALSPTTGTPNTWNPGADNTVQTMVYANGLLYVGGDFLNVSGVARSRAAALNGTTGAATAWDPTAYGTVSTLAAARGKVLIGGTFNGVGGLPRRNAAAFNVRTGQATAWAPDVNNVIQTMVAGPSSMFLGGSFTAIGTAARTSLGEVDLVTGQPTAWAPACNGQVLALARTTDRLYVGGLYTSLGGAPHTNLGAVELTNGLASAWTADASDQVYALDANGPSLLVGGNFLVLGGVNRSFVGAVDLSSGVTTPWAPEANAGPRTFVRLCDRILVGGNFTAIGGQLRNRAAALDPTTGAALAWNPDANATVFAIHAQPGVVYLGGSMTLVGGQVRNRAAAVDPATGVLLPWNPNANGIVRALAQSGSRVLMSGSFSAVNAQPSGTVASVPNEASAICGTLAIAPGDLPVLPIGAPGSITLTASGGTAPYCWKLSSGTLPAGFTFDTATGVLSGTPTAQGTTVLGFTATDARGCSTAFTDTLITRTAGGLAFVTEPTTVAAGTAIAPAVSVRVRNLLGDPAVGSPVTLLLQGTGVLSGARTALADTAGIATFDDVRLDLVGSKQLVAQADSIPQLPTVTSAMFTVTAGPVALLAFTATPDSGVAGVVLSPATVVRAQDAFGNLVPGANVVLSLASGDSLTGLATVATDSLGLARFTALSVSHAATQQLVATVGGVQANGPAFLVRPAAPATLTFTTPPSDHIAGQTMAEVVVRASDAFGNPTPGTAVQLSLVGTGVLSGTLTATSDSTGIARFAGLTSDRSGLQQLLASSGNLALTSPRYRVSPATAASLAFTTQPSNVVAGVAIATAVAVVAHDAFGNGVPGVAIALSMSGTGTLSGGAGVTTDSTGIATFVSISVDRVGSKTLTATSDLFTATSSAFNVSPAAAASLAFTTQPSAVVAGVAIVPAVTILARDAFGNDVPGASVALTMTGTGTLTGGAAVSTDSLGIAHFPALSANLVGSKTLTASSGLLTATSDAFIVSHAAAASLAFTTQPSAVVAGVVMTPAVTVIARDTFGNEVPGIPVVLTMTGTGTLAGGAEASTDATGTVVFNAVSVDRIGSKTLTASSGLLSATSSAFTVSPAAAASLAFTTQPSAVVAGVTLAPAVTVVARDAFDNIVPGVSIALSMTGTGTLTGGATVSTDSAGIGSFGSLSVDLVGSKTLTATSGLLSMTSDAFTVSPAATASLAFTTQPSAVVAGVAIAPAVTVVAHDAFGNNVPGASVALTMTGTGALTGGTAVLTDATGTATFTAISMDLVGSKTLTASSGLITATSSAFVVSHAAAASLTFTTQPSAVVAGVAMAPAITVVAHDAFGNSVPGVEVALSITGTGTLTGGAGVTTDSTGIATFVSISVDRVGSKTLTATSDLLTATSSAFTVSPAAAASLAFTTQPSAVVAGVAIAPAVTVLARDAFGNDVPGVSVALTMTGTGTLTGGAAVSTDSLGIAHFPALSANLVGSKTLTASSGLLTTTSSTFTVSPAAAASLAFTTQPSAVEAGVVMTPAISVVAHDAFGNHVPGVSIALSMTGTGTLTGGAAVTTDATGTATYDAVSVNLAGSKTLTASSGLLSATSSAFTVSPAAAASLAFTTQPSAVVAGVAIAPAVTVVARDAFDNIVPGVSIALSMTGTGTLTGGATVSTDSAGIGSFGSLSVDLVGSKTLTATSGLLSMTSDAFTVSPAATASLAFTTQPSAVVAGVAIAPAVTVVAHDAFGNNVPGASVALTMTGTGALTGGTAVLTDATGTATFTAISLDLVGSKTLTASSGPITTTSAAFVVSHAAAASLTFTTQPSAVVAGVAMAPAITVLAHDAFGNSVPGVSVALSMTGTGTLTGGAAVLTDANGTATYSAVAVNLVGDKTLTATSDLLTATSSAFTVSPAAAASLAFTTQPSAVVAGVAIAPAVTVLARDAFGNDVPGVSVALTMTGIGTLAGGTAVSTDALGIAHFSALSANLVGSKTLTASSGLLTATSDAFIVSHAAAASLAFTTQPSAVVAGVVMTPAVTVIARDTFGNEVPGIPVVLTMTGTGTLAGGAEASTDATGTVVFNAVSVDRIGSKTLTASSGLLSATSSAFTVSPAAAASLAFTTQPSAVVAGVAIAPAVTVVARDAFGNLVPGLAVDLALIGTGTLSGVASVTTDATGVATYATLSVDLVGSKGLTATSDSIMATSSTFAVVPAPAASLAFTTQPSAVVAGIAIAPAVQVIAHDAFGNTVPDAPIALTLNGSGVLTGGDAVASDSTGVATFPALSLTLVGDKTLTARTGAIVTTSEAFLVSASSPATLAFLTPPSDVVAGVAIAPAVRIAVTDVFGNVVPSGVITVSEPDGNTLAGRVTIVSDSSGIATFADLMLTRAGRHTLLVTSGAHSARSDSFTVVAAAPATLAFMTPPSASIAGRAIVPTVTVVAHDAFDNPVPATPVGLSLEGAGSLLSDTVSVTDAQGFAMFPTLAVDRVGDHALRASIDTLTSLSPSFTIVPGAPATLTFLAAPSDLVAGGVMSPAVQVLAHDAFGNPVPGADVTLAAATLTGGETVTTDALGVATFPSLSLTLAGSHTLTATSGTASSTSPSFGVSPASPASLAFVIAPSDVVAGEAIAPAVQVLAQDRFGNLAPGTAVSLALDGTGMLVGGEAVLTDAQGRASFAGLTLDRMGRKALTASFDSLQVTSGSFAVAPAAAASLVFAATPADAVAGIDLSPAVEVQAQDRFGNPALGSTVQLALTTTGRLSGPTSARVDSLGLAVFPTLSIDLAGSHALSATSGPAQATSDTIHVTHAAAARLAFTTSPSDVEAGAPMTPSVQVTVLDAFDNPVPGTAVVLSLVGEGTLVGGEARTSDDAGRVTFDALGVDRAGSHTLVATSGALSSSSTSFTVRPATVTSLAFLTGPTDVVAGAVMATAIRVEARDAYTNPVAGASITLSLEGPGSLGGALTAATSTDGVASFSDLTLDRAGPTSLTAHHDSLSLTSGTFTVSPAAPAALTFVSQPGVSVAGDVIAPSVTVLVEDAFANVVPGATVVMSRLGTGTLSGTTSATSDHTGLASFSALVLDRAGVQQLSAASGAAQATSATFAIAAAAADHLAYLTGPRDAVAGVALSPAITVLVEDRFGNAVAGHEVALTLDADTLTVGLATMTDAAGLATFADVRVGAMGAHTLRTRSLGLNALESSPFVIGAAPAASLSFVVAPTTTVAGVTMAPAVQVRALDAYGNPVAGLPIALATSGAVTLTGGAPVPSDANGVATFAGLKLTLAGSHSLLASSGALNATSTPFAILAATPRSMAFAVAPTNAVAGAVIAPAVQVKVSDVYGNGVPAVSLSLAVTGGGTLIGGAATPTGADGLATFAGLAVDLAGSHTLVAQSTGLTFVASPTFVITPGAARTLTFTTQPASATAGATLSPPVRVRVTDAYGNGVPGTGVSVAMSDGTPLAGNLSTTSNSAGFATFGTLSSTVAGPHTLTASSGSLTPAISASFTITSAGAASLAFVSQPLDARAGSTLSPALRVRASDVYGNRVAGGSISLTLTGGGTLAGSVAMPSDSDGVATFADLTVDRAGSHTLVATLGTATTTSATFAVSPASPAAVAFAIEPSDATAGAAITPGVQVRVTDAFANAVPDAFVSLALGTPGTLTGADSLRTDAQGLARFSALRVVEVGTHTLVAQQGALRATSRDFRITAAGAATITWQVQPSATPVATAVAPAPEVLVRDAYGNVVPAAPVTLTLVGSGALTGGAATSDAQGVARFASLRVDRAGVMQLVAGSGTATGSASATFTVSCPELVLSALGVDSTSAGVPFARTLSTTGGTAPYRYAVSAGTLPVGLTLAANGVLSGSPSASGTATFTVSATDSFACSVSRSYALTVIAVPVAIADLSVTRAPGVGDGDGTIGLRLAFTPSPAATRIEVYRAPFGGYPRYDESGGVDPLASVYPPSAPWVRTTITASGQVDETPVRDAWSYVVFQLNALGQVSAASNHTVPMPNYRLGDNSNGRTRGVGDNRVDLADLSLLGAHYGVGAATLASDSLHFLDVGPTLDHTLKCRPTTDGRVDFEDLAVLATEYGNETGTTSFVAQANGMIRRAHGTERVSYDAPDHVRADETFAVVVRLEGAGRLQALSTQLVWDESVAEPIAMEPSDWVAAQDGMTFSARPGNVDAAILGVHEHGFVGAGVLATLRFRARRDGAPAIQMGHVEGRDAANRGLSSEVLTVAQRELVPTQTVQFAPTPNPSRGEATLSFALAKPGRVEFDLFGVDGRHVRSFANGPHAAGLFTLRWNGDDDQHRRVAPGVYFARLITPDHRSTRRIVVLP